MSTRKHAASAVAVLAFLALGCADAPTAVTDPVFDGAGGGPPLTGSGTGFITSLQITSSRTAGGNTIQERFLTGVITGSLNGTFTEHVRGVIHASGRITFQGTMEFTGTAQGCTGSGTVTGSLAGTGVAGVPTAESNFAITGQGRNTLRVTGHGTISQVGPALSYDVQYVCR